MAHSELFLGRAASAGSPASWHDPAVPGFPIPPPSWQWWWLGDGSNGIVLATLVHISSNHFISLYLFMVYHGLSHLTFGKSPNRSAYHHGLSWFIMINITCLSWFIMLYPSRSPAPVESTERLGLESMAPFGPVMILVDTRPQWGKINTKNTGKKQWETRTRISASIISPMNPSFSQ